MEDRHDLGASTERSHGSTRSATAGDLENEGASGAPPDVCGEEAMDERLIADARASRLHAQGPQDVGIEANRDQLAGRTPERRSANSPRASQLLVGQLRDVREVNRLGSRTPLALYDSPPAR
jgi:hypothetical protein